MLNMVGTHTQTRCVGHRIHSSETLDRRKAAARLLQSKGEKGQPCRPRRWNPEARVGPRERSGGSRKGAETGAEVVGRGGGDRGPPVFEHGAGAALFFGAGIALD